MNQLTSRRDFLARAGGGLVIALTLPSLVRAQVRRMDPSEMRKVAATPNAFLRIAPDDSVTLLSKHIEFGQGSYTGLATLAAEELDADWSQMRVEAAPADVNLYANLNMGQQGTGGSSAMLNSYWQMRKAGAAARGMLVAAAAKAWGVPAGEITVDRGVIAHAASGRTSGFGAFADAAAKMPFPADPPTKDPSQFRLIGSELPKIDSLAKSTGKAVFTFDMVRPGMVQSAILHPPAFGARVTKVDAVATLALPDVLAVHEVPRGVVVIAKTRFAAQRGVNALKVDWDMSKAETRSSEEMFRTYAEAAKAPGAKVELKGDVEQGLAASAKTLEAEYRFPFLAHATMEPPGAVVEVGRDGAEVWMGSQLTTADQKVIAETLALKPEQVKINIMYTGGSFGRLGTPASELSAEAVSIGKAWGKGPVKHLWSRENDIRGGRYRPMSVHRLRGGIDAAGNITTWDQVIAIQSFLAGTSFGGAVRNGVDGSGVEGARGMAYDIPNFHIGQHIMDNGVPSNFWRSVGHSHTGYSVETFVDELFELGGRDPVKGRLGLIKPDDVRMRGVIERVADMAQWSGRKGKGGRAYGIAAIRAFRTCAAEIVELSMGDDGQPRVHKVWCAVDCGVAINPDVIRAQMEGGIGFALGAVLYGEVTIGAGGHPQQSNFDSYRVLRMPEMPAIEVSIIKSGADPTGVGEPGVPPLGPALGNAWRALTGKSVRDLPFIRGDRT